MGYEEDIGKFVNISYINVEGIAKHARGRLLSVEGNTLIIVDVKNPAFKRRVDLELCKVADYTAEPVKEVK